MKITSTKSIRLSVPLHLFGLVWGLSIPSVPFPRLALSAHLHSMLNGALLTVVGQPDLISLSPFESFIVTWGLNSMWISIASECAKAYWYVSFQCTDVHDYTSSDLLCF